MRKKNIEIQSVRMLYIIDCFDKLTNGVIVTSKKNNIRNKSTKMAEKSEFQTTFQHNQNISLSIHVIVYRPTNSRAQLDFSAELEKKAKHTFANRNK